MVTGGEIILRKGAKALPWPSKSAKHDGNLRWGACIVIPTMLGFVTTEKLNQAHPARKVSAVALL